MYNIRVENLTDTIAAISTGTAGGAISIVRLSGNDAINIADKMFIATNGKKPSSLPARYLQLGKLEAEGFTEQAMCVTFVAPNSYTGQNMVEFQCHGGHKIASGVLQKCLSLGARLATNGEFTKRAFVNGKISLSAAEGMIDMINAESDSQVRAGYNLLTGKLSKFASDAEAELVDILSEIEVSFDYPEETIEYITKAKVKDRLTLLAGKMSDILATASDGKIISTGINVLIVGKPNVGKSSLLNSLLAQDRALVTDIAGTTRDVVEGSLSLNGIKVNFVDTAGIHDTEDIVERLGVKKAKELTSSADIIIFVTDASSQNTAEDEQIYSLVKDKNYISVINKADVLGENGKKQKYGKSGQNTITISAKTGQGISELKQEIISRFNSPNLSGDGVVLTNERHKQALLSALQNINSALAGLQDNPLDLVAIDIKLAYTALGEITGTTTGEDIIDAIFSKFCLGK